MIFPRIFQVINFSLYRGAAVGRTKTRKLHKQSATQYANSRNYSMHGDSTTPQKRFSNLVGGFNPSEKYLSNGIIVHNIWKNKIHVPNHQLVFQQ